MHTDSYILCLFQVVHNHVLFVFAYLSCLVSLLFVSCTHFVVYPVYNVNLLMVGLLNDNINNSV